MKVPKIKINMKNFEQTIRQADRFFGKFDFTATIDVDGYPITLLVQEPSKEKPFFTLITVGLQFMRFPQYRKKLEGFELLMRLHYSWKFPKNESDENAWPIHIIKGIASVMLSGSVMLPDMTYEFEPFTDKTPQHIAIVNHSDYYLDRETVLPLQKRDVIYLEVQTMLDDEFHALRNGNEKIRYLVFSLPCIDLNRESLCPIAK